MSKNSHAKHEHKVRNHNYVASEKPHEDYKAGWPGDIVIFILIVGLGLFFILPFYWIMPAAGSVLIILSFVLVLIGFVAVIGRRKKRNK